MDKNTMIVAVVAIIAAVITVVLIWSMGDGNYSEDCPKDCGYVGVIPVR
jgi:nitrogen fixation-related uncharacterized protein